jgi:hypothetical protein
MITDTLTLLDLPNGQTGIVEWHIDAGQSVIIVLLLVLVILQMYTIWRTRR